MRTFKCQCNGIYRAAETHSLGSFMDASICQRLSSVEVDFLAAISENDDALISSYQNFAILWTDIESCLRANTINEKTMQRAYFTASRIDSMANSLLNYNVDSDDLSSALQ